MASRTVLHADNLRFSAPDAGCLVLSGVTLSLVAGEIVDVTGPSGSGKTTLLRALARLLPDATGSLELAGMPAEEISSRQWRLRVALLPQIAVLRRGSVRDNLLLPWTLHVRSAEEPPTDEALREALAGVGLSDIELGRDAARLSVGQAARISLLRVTLTAPEVLLLDEPDANLDDDSAAQVASLTQRFSADGGAVVRVRHLRRDGTATRTLRLASGLLEEVAK